MLNPPTHFCRFHWSWVSLQLFPQDTSRRLSPWLDMHNETCGFEAKGSCWPKPAMTTLSKMINRRSLSWKSKNQQELTRIRGTPSCCCRRTVRPQNHRYKEKREIFVRGRRASSTSEKKMKNWEMPCHVKPISFKARKKFGPIFSANPNKNSNLVRGEERRGPGGRQCLVWVEIWFICQN